MKRFARVLVLGVLALVVLVGAAAAAKPPAVSSPRTVVAWPFEDPYGSFAESMALGPDGFLYVSRTVWGDTSDTGLIERVSPATGAITLVAEIDAAYGLIAGVAFDPSGRLYVAVPTFSDDVLPHVVRVEPDGTTTTVLTLPGGSFPNGLAFHAGYLYVTDVVGGAVWRVRPGTTAAMPDTPWLEDPAIAPVEEFGPNGIAFHGRTLYLTQYDRGQILTSELQANDLPGPLHVYAEDPALVTADGIAFAPGGDLWVTVNGPGTGRVVAVQPGGAVVVAADQPAWLDYPTQPVVTPSGKLYVSNGAFTSGTPSVVALTMD